MMMKNYLFFFIFIIISCSPIHLPESTQIYNQLVNIEYDNQKINFNAKIYLANDYMNAYIYSLAYPGTINIKFVKGSIHISHNVKLPENIINNMTKDMIITYFGGNFPFFMNKEKYNYNYKIKNNIKTVYTNNNILVYRILYKGSTILINNIKYNYKITVISDKGIIY